MIRDNEIMASILGFLSYTIVLREINFSPKEWAVTWTQNEISVQASVHCALIFGRKKGLKIVQKL